jgi:IclR family pca regulon transcriptional regulator
VRAPAHLVAAGRVILSTRGEERLERWIAAHDFSAFTAHTAADPTVFREEVLASRAYDHWSRRRTWPSGWAARRCRSRTGEATARGAIGMTVQVQSLATEAMVQTLLALLLDATRALRPIL